MRFVKFGSFVFGSFVILSASAATTYYVDATTGDDGYDGSSPTVDGEGVGPKKTWLAIKAMFKNGEIESGSVFRFAPGRYVTGGVLTNDLKNLTFEGTGTDRSDVVFDGEGTGGFFTAKAETRHVFRNLTVSNCYASASSGDRAPGMTFLLTGSNPLIDTCAFFCCTNASTTGEDRGSGKQLSWGGALTFCGSGVVTNTLFQQNYAKYGGAVSSGPETASRCYYYDCEFVSNGCFYVGGALQVGDSAAACQLWNCKFTGNQAVGTSGGGGATTGSATLITNCLFVGNSAKSEGGACRFPLARAIKDCTFAENTAKNGGAIRLSESDSVLRNCRFLRNKATGAGGAIYLQGSPALFRSLADCDFICNASSGAGGAVWGTVGHMENCRFLTNVCWSTGSALFQGANSYSELKQKLKPAEVASYDWIVTNCVFVANSNAVTRDNSTYAGGTVNLKSSFYQKFVDCVFNDNIFNVNGSMSVSQGNYEGGVVYAGWDAGFERCGFTNNLFTCGHGACFAGVSTSGVRRCSFVGNRAALETGLDYRDSSGGALFFMNYETGSPTSVAGITNVVEDCEFLTNSVKGVGGAAIASMFGALKVKGCAFRGNYNDPTGVWTGCKRSGTILVYGYLTKNTGNCFKSWNTLDTEIDGCLFEDDDTYGRGGAINLSDTQYNSTFVQGSATVRNCFFKGCDIKSTLGGSEKSSSGYGGAICCGTQKVEIANCTFTGLTAVKGGAIYVNGTDNNTTVTNCVFYDNGDTQNNSTTFDMFGVAADKVGYCYAREGGAVAEGNGNIVSDQNPFRSDDHTAYAVRKDCGSGVGLNTLDWMTPDAIDCGGKPRLAKDGSVDIGCYQFWRKPGLLLFVW